MATIVGQTLVDRAASLLYDTTNIRWPSDELLKWLNDGQREIVAYKPEAGAKIANVTCVTGTKQAIPTDGVVLLDVVRNMGTNGTTPGRAVTLVKRDVLDGQRPGWHTETGAAETKHYVFDPRAPKNFYVYPPQPGSSMGQLEVIYAAAPADIVIGATINVDDIYANALLAYILFRAYSKAAKETFNPELATANYQHFLNALGGKTQAEEFNAPARAEQEDRR